MDRSAVAQHSDSLPEYRVRVSARARRIRLTVTPREGLVVVVPQRWRGDPSRFVAEKADWARAALASVADRRALFSAGPEGLLPDLVELRAFGETWPVEYRSTASASVRARAEGSLLVVSGAVDDAERCLAALTRWLDRTARERLLPLLAETAEAVGLAYTSARVRQAEDAVGLVFFAQDDLPQPQSGVPARAPGAFPHAPRAGAYARHEPLGTLLDRAGRPRSGGTQPPRADAPGALARAGVGRCLAARGQGRRTAWVASHRS